MNYLALKVKIGDNYEYLDLNSDLSFTKSNPLYLFSEVEFNRSVNIKIPSTSHNLEILNNPDLPIMDNQYMTVRLECRLTLENGDIYGTLIVNKSSEHSLDGVFIFDSSDVLSYINEKQVKDISLPDSTYSIQWYVQNATYANDISLDTKKIAIIPYMNDADRGWYEPNTSNATPNAELFYKSSCWYPSIKISALIKDILQKAKDDTQSNTDISHLYDEVPIGLVNNTWLIVDKLNPSSSVGEFHATFRKTGNLTITDGLGQYGPDSIGLNCTAFQRTLCRGAEWSLWDGWDYDMVIMKTFGFSKNVKIRFNNVPAHCVIANCLGTVGCWNLKTGKHISSIEDCVELHNGDIIEIPTKTSYCTHVSFTLFDSREWELDDSSYTPGRFYFKNEYNNGNWTINGDILVDFPVPEGEEGEEPEPYPYMMWNLSNNPLEIGVMDLIKTFAYTTGTQFVFEPEYDSKNPKRGSLKFVKTDIHSTKDLYDVSKIDSLEKKVGSYSGQEIITFSPADYVEDMGSDVPSLAYITNNSTIESKNKRELPVDCGAIFTGGWSFHFIDLSGSYLFPSSSEIFFRKDISLDIEANEDGSIKEVEPQYDSPGLTIATTSSTFNGSDYKRRVMRRIDQRFADPLPVDVFYQDIFNNSTKYSIQFPLELQEYFDLSGYTDFWYNGVRYAWFKLQWQKGICKGEFQKYTDYLTSYYQINVLADPELAGSVSGGGSFRDGDTTLISVQPAFGCILDYWEDEQGNIISHDLSFEWTVHEDKTFTAHFIMPKYYVDLTSAPDGSYGSLSGEGYYDALSTCTVVAHPNTGCYFVGWYKNNELLSTNTSYSFTVVSNTSLVGQFEQYPNYHITLGVEGVASGVEVGLSGAGYYQGGTTASVSVSINELQRESSYTFLGWYENNQQVSISNPYSFTVNSNRHLVAKFQHKVKITISSKNPYGIEGTWTGDGYYTQGDTAILQAFPNSGLQFLDWLDLDSNTVYSTSNPLVITNIQTDLNLYIEWDSVETDIYVNILPRTGGTTTGQGTYAIGSTVRIEATPNTGYTFVKWVDELGTEIINNPYTFTAAVNKTFTPVYNQTTYTITGIARPSNAGYVEGNGTTFHYNDLCVLTAIPYTRGYSFVNWTDENDNIVSTSTPYYFNVSQSLTLYANFTSDTTYYNVSCRVRPSGSGTVNGFGSYEAGSTCTLRATPNTGYVFLGYYNTSDVLVSSNANYSFTVNSNVSLVAKFDKAAPSQYTITLVNEYPETGCTVQFGIPSEQYTITLNTNIDDGNTVQFDNPEYTITLNTPDDEAGDVNFDNN